MASVAGKLLQQVQACVSQATMPEKSKADFAGFYAGFECTYSSSQDLERLPHELKRWPFEPEQPPWMVGRQHQLELLSRLVPDRHLFSSIGRAHFELRPEPDKEQPTLRLRSLSPNPLKVDGLSVAAGESGSEVTLRDGSSVSFCFQGEVFLTLQFLIRRGVEAAPTQEALPQPLDTVPTVARSSPAAYALVCDRLAGETVDHLPKEERKILISSEGPTSIGRQCQPGFFENLQKLSRSQWVFVGYVSRTHFQVTGLAEELPPSKVRFEVTNCSSNPILLAGRELPGRARQVIQVGDTIELIAQDGTGVSPYLRFRLLWLGQSRSTSSLASRATEPGTILLDRQGSKESQKARPPFQLVLAGSSVLKGLPDAFRVVDAGDNGLTIGRAHQRELHEKSFVEGVLGYISRDHFSIRCSRDGAFSLVPLSQNPIWLSRRGRLQRLMVGDAPPRLEDGDAVLLFTGAEDLSPEGPGSFGSLRWVFRLCR
ncbi:Otud3 [Symbiodinium sp. KB8]|nr:Otud3 [Symbiodinium sp. KB8]